MPTTPVSQLLKLAKQGDANAIATLLSEKLEPKGIWVIAQRQGEQLDLIFESLQPPPKTALAKFIESGMRSLNPVGLRQVLLHGRQMGESTDAWQYKIKLQFTAPPEPDAIADIEDDSTLLAPPPPASVTQTIDLQNPPDSNPNALVTAAQQGQKGAISRLLVHEFRRDNVVVRTKLMGTCLQVDLSGPDATDQAEYLPRVQGIIADLQLPFAEQVRVQAINRTQDEPLWRVDYDPRDPKYAPSPVTEPFKGRKLDAGGRNCLAWGLAIAVLLFLVPITRFILNYFVILVHELGHAIAFWLFGYLAVPTFNFMDGGGITLPLGRLSLLTTIILGGLGYLCYHYRHNIPTQRFCGIVLLSYAVLNFTPLHNIVVVAMGHGGELGAIAFCLYCALGNYYCPVPGERFLFAMLGWFTLFSTLGFMGQLIFSNTFRAEYFNGIGGRLDNDLVILARDYHLLGVVPLAMMFWVGAIAAFGLAWWGFRYERRWVTGLAQRLVQHPAQLD